MAEERRALTLSVWTFEDASLAVVQAAMQDFLQGLGTPALTDSARVHGEVVIRDTGSTFYAYIVYSE